jgi:hypothetical protein
LAAPDFDGTGFNGQGSPLPGDVVVRGAAGSVLEGPPGHADTVGHVVQLVDGIGQHVAHDHAPKGRPHVVDIDGH